MDTRTMKTILEIGETIAVEFKRCGNGIESDVYETVCSFLNRFGGDIFLGVLDDGTVSGVPEKQAPDMVKNFISCISNPALFSPTIYLNPEILDYEGKKLIHIHILPSAEVHSYKKVIYDRVNDADVKVTATAQIAQMYIRKQEIYTEKKIFPYVGLEDLRLDLLPKLRIMAANNSGQTHPWSSMSDEEVLKSTRLYSIDRVTGAKGYNLAAVMLLGKDDVIADVVPAYVTDALLRKVQNQQKELPGFPGAVLFTTNCIQNPKDYGGKVFTSGIVGWPGLVHIKNRDFAPLILKALELPGFAEDAPGKEVTVGFGRKTLLDAAPAVLDAVKSGAVRHIFLVGGCDGAKPGRNYYTEFVEKTPQDTLILTLACGKFRFFDKDLGKIGPFPRLLDVGQCNDAYSAVKVALALADALKCGVNDLPLSLVLSWYEQKAVAILLTLLALGVKNIHLGPSLPAFVSPDILNLLVENWGIKPISTPDEDLKALLG